MKKKYLHNIILISIGQTLPCPWDSPGKNTGVGCHFLLQCRKGKSESEVAQRKAKQKQERQRKGIHVSMLQQPAV